MLVNLLAGITLTIGLIISLLFSGFIVFVVASSQQGRTGTSLLLFQLGSTNGILALLFLTLSMPSLLQDRWLTGFAHSSRPSTISGLESEVRNKTPADSHPVHGKQQETLEITTTLRSSPLGAETTSMETSTELPQTDNRDSEMNSVDESLHVVINHSHINDRVTVVDSRAILTTSMPNVRNNSDMKIEVSVTSEAGFPTPIMPVSKMLVIPNITLSPKRANVDSMMSDRNEFLGEVLSIVNMTSSYDATIAEHDNFPKSVNFHVKEDVFCRIYGWLLITLHVAAVWIIVGLQCDKFISISSPLRYNTLLTRNRIAAYSIMIWVIAFVASSLPFAIADEYMFTGGACLPAWHNQGSLPFIFILLSIMLFIPGCVIAAVNIRIIIIARRHHHRIFSAIFEVMMSAQATVTHQRNPFDIPKKWKKSTLSVVEQMIAFALCYCPIFTVALWETFLRQRINHIFELLAASFLLASPLINSFLYGIKCKSLRKAFKNYLRKRLYKSEVRSEIEARIPSAQNSRRPSVNSSVAMPFLHRTLKRRMSDYLAKDNEEDDGGGFISNKMVRRSSDLSWHPLEEGTPSPDRFRKPLAVNFPGSKLSDDGSVSVSQYLTVPSFKAARSYQSLNEKGRGSIGSVESECLSEIAKESLTEEEPLTTPDVSPLNAKSQRISKYYNSKMLCMEKNRPVESVSMKEFFLQDELPEEISPRGKSYSLHCPRTALEDVNQWRPPAPYTPLLISAYMKPISARPVNTSSPYVAQTIDALMSIGLSQSLLKFSSLWRCQSKESLKDGSDSPSSKYVAIPLEVVEKEHSAIQREETSKLYQVSANCSAKDISKRHSANDVKKEVGEEVSLKDIPKVFTDITMKCESNLSVDTQLVNINNISVNIRNDVSEVK